MAPRQQQGNSTFTEVGIPALGMDTDTVPRLLPPTKAPLLKNFLMDRPGVLPMRGPICEGTAWNPGSGIAPVGQWVFDDKVLVSRYSATIQPPTGVAALAVPGGSLAPNTRYYYKVTALTAGGETTPGLEVSDLTSSTKLSVQISWNPVVGAIGYRVYRGTSSGGESVFFAPGAVILFTDTGTAGTAGTPPTSNTATITATRDTWVAPYRKASNASQLRGLSLTSKVVDLLNNTASDLVAATADGVPGLKSVRVGPYVYGHAGDAATNVTQNGAVYKKTKLLRWDGSATPVVYTNGPQCSQDITYHYNRLFVLGGIPQGGSVIGFNSLFWSDQLPTDGTALPDTAAAWQDDVSGLVNQLVIGADDGSDFGVAVAHVGASLLILKRRSLWILRGTSSANFRVDQVSDEVGCIDPRSVATYREGVYFMSDRGLQFYDGVNTREVSQGVRTTLVNSALKQSGPTGADGGYARATKLGSGYILVTTGVVDGTSLASTADSDAWLLHVPTGAWTQLSTGAVSSLVGGGRTVNYAYLLGDTRAFRASYLFNPTAAPAGFRGLDSVDGSVTSFLIPSRWTSRALALSTPPRKSKLQRITADYYWGLANGGWQVTTTTRGATGVATNAGTLAAPTGITATLPARGAIDIFNETDEVYLDIAASAGTPATFNDAEIHRVLIASIGTANVPASL